MKYAILIVALMVLAIPAFAQTATTTTTIPEKVYTFEEIAPMTDAELQAIVGKRVEGDAKITQLFSDPPTEFPYTLFTFQSDPVMARGGSAVVSYRTHLPSAEVPHYAKGQRVRISGRITRIWLEVLPGKAREQFPDAVHPTLDSLTITPIQ